ncbi:hypothetical protein QC762_0050150 [Podospora pseudocomata]|uniref:Amidase domain-containing protein n=1 Tax=Podospora pseudocomata TaxID=2093779 RepID=A0ABR0GI74_9PEZI|nr:hypothetical protein QC762_0050150 [Podospora pseudocomata]
MLIPSQSWQTHAAEKRESLLASIPDGWKLSPEDFTKAKSQRDNTGVVREHLEAAEALILAKDAPDIVSHLKDGTYSAVQVTTSSCKAAAIAHQIGNCLMKSSLTRPWNVAKALDAHFKETGTASGPLHNLPVSLKDQFRVKGVYTTMGYVG